jgi:hypothetical protein
MLNFLEFWLGDFYWYHPRMTLPKLKWQNKIPSFIDRLSSARTPKRSSKWKKTSLVEAQTPWKWDQELMMKKGKASSPSNYLGYYPHA